MLLIQLFHSLECTNADGIPGTRVKSVNFVFHRETDIWNLTCNKFLEETRFPDSSNYYSSWLNELGQHCQGFLHFWCVL